jgi:hypothetical protein
MSNLTKKDLLKVSGSFAALGTVYNVSGIEARRDPLFWQLNASLNVSAANVAIPITLRLTQQERSFTQPFNQYGLSPKYKAFTVHLGFRSMKFSEFSLSGNQFMGVGIEIAPKDAFVTGKVLIGRFARAVDGFYQDGSVIGTPSYERWGYGSQITLGKKNNNFGFQVFKAKDDENSIQGFADDATVKPGDNLVFGTTTHHRITKELTLDAEIDWSAYTEDTRVPETVLEGYSYLNNLGSLLYANTTSTFNKAMYAKLKYKKNKLGLKLNYRRIDPEYKTMGSVYLNNDFEDITAGASYQFLDKKLSANVSGGFQRNNLNDDKVSEMARLISSVAVNYTPNQTWNFSSTFSNFNAQSQMTLVNSFDTIRYAQVTKNAGLQIARNTVKNSNRIGITTGLNFQNAQINGEINTVFYNAQLGFRYGITKTKTNFSLNISANRNIAQGIETTAVGPSASVGKVIFKSKISLSYVASFLKSFTDDFSDGFIVNNKLAAKYKIDKHHALMSNVSLIRRESIARTFTETIASIGYNFTF